MEEDRFVEEVLAAAEEILAPPLLIVRHACLLYQVTVDNRLQVTVDIANHRAGTQHSKPIFVSSKTSKPKSEFRESCWSSRRGYQHMM